MNEFLPLLMISTYPTLNHLYSKPKKNYFIASRRIE
jgi:hypothetical protein